MSIEGSPTSLELFGLQDSESNSQDLYTNSASSSSPLKDQFATPNNKRSCSRPPNASRETDLVSPLSAVISKSVQGIYCSQEVKDQDSHLQGLIWTSLKALKDKTDVLESYSIKNILHGKCLYRGKVAHISAIIKSVEAMSKKDTSLIIHDNTGEIKAAVHSKVMEKYGSMLEPGVGLLLRQCTIFSFISVQKYVNITLPNIVHIFNASSLEPAPEIINNHILEVSEVNVQRIKHPDRDNQTPNITLNTPNLPPRPSRVTPRTSTPQDNTPRSYNSKNSTPQSNFTTPQRTWTPQRSRFPQRKTSPNQTPTRRNNSQSNHTTPQKQHVYNNVPTPNIVSGSVGVAENVPRNTENRKRSSREGETPHKRSKTTLSEGGVTPLQTNVVRSSHVSPKEKEEIEKILEGIDDSDFFDDF